MRCELAISEAERCPELVGDDRYRACLSVLWDRLLLASDGGAALYRDWRIIVCKKDGNSPRVRCSVKGWLMMLTDVSTQGCSHICPPACRP